MIVRAVDCGTADGIETGPLVEGGEIIEPIGERILGRVALEDVRDPLEDTLLILTSDHGEAFGEHGLYLHDASLYETHLHVPLWVHHPEASPAQVRDVVSTRELFSLMRSAAFGRGVGGTILEPTAQESWSRIVILLGASSISTSGRRSLVMRAPVFQ